ncbi:hypothetical protein BJF78_34815 [Pseudonocardia sp. CNS-139]|nr:hypothetical protein BJF78_34815 [Pseudonocardia sp. CNS-139]
MRTEAAERAAFRAAVPDATWEQVRDHLRAVELHGLHPAEQAALWERADRVEEIVDRLPVRYRDPVYRALVDAGVTSVAQLAARSVGELADLGLPAAATRALRGALAGVTVPVRGDTFGADVAAALAGKAGWTYADLAAALRVAAGLPQDPAAPVTSAGLAQLRTAAGIDRLAVLADALLARLDAGTLPAAERALLPAGALDVLTRARAGGLTAAELPTLVAYGSGALRTPGPAGRAAQQVALLVLDAHLRATLTRPAAAPHNPARVHGPPARLLGAAVVATGVAGGLLGVLLSGGGPLSVVFALAGAAVGRGAAAALGMVRNRGPPAVANATAPTATGLAARRWTDRVVIGAPLLTDLVTQDRALGALIGAGLLGAQLMPFGVPGAGLVAVGAAVAAVVVGLLPAVLPVLRPLLPTARHAGIAAAAVAVLAAGGLAVAGHGVAAGLTLAGTVLAAVTAGVVHRLVRPGAPRAPPASNGLVRRIGAGAATVALLGALGASVMGGLGRPAEAAPNTVTVQVVDRHYVTVQPGDTLIGLARALGVPVAALADANPGRFPTAASRNAIDVGERLAVPAGWDGAYHVQPGDTLNAIAARLGVDPTCWRRRRAGGSRTAAAATTSTRASGSPCRVWRRPRRTPRRPRPTRRPRPRPRRPRRPTRPRAAPRRPPPPRRRWLRSRAAGSRGGPWAAGCSPCSARSPRTTPCGRLCGRLCGR